MIAQMENSGMMPLKIAQLVYPIVKNVIIPLHVIRVMMAFGTIQLHLLVMLVK